MSALPTTTDIELSAVFSDNPRTAGLLDGSIRVEGIQLRTSALHPSEMFWRQLKFAEFDVSEMSCSSLLIATSQGPTEWVAIPVFTTRFFFHTRVIVRTDAGIEKPEDLNGKRIGVPEYQQTAAVWARGILKDEFGVDPRTIEWHMERNPEMSHGGSTGFTAPEGVRLTYIPPSTNIGEMLAQGELDAALFYLASPNLVDRSRSDISKRPDIRRLFPDEIAEGARYYAKTGIYPINHTLVVKRAVYERYPWIALNLYRAFLEQQDALTRRRIADLEPWIAAGLVDAATIARLRNDPFAYGLRAARPVLEALTRYQVDQGLASRRVGLEEIFAKSTLDL